MAVSSWVSVGLFLLVLVCVPMVLKFAQRRYGVGLALQVQGQPSIVSALSLGPGQRLVMVDVGPDHARERLTLGVTAQGIHCLHRFPVPAPTTTAVAPQ